MTWPKKTKKEKGSVYFVKDLEISMHASTMYEREEKEIIIQYLYFQCQLTQLDNISTY